MKNLKIFGIFSIISACVSVTSSSFATTEYIMKKVNGEFHSFPIVNVTILPTSFKVKKEEPSNRSGTVQNLMTAIENQGQLGTCATFASVGAVERYFSKPLSEECLLRYRGGFNGDLPMYVTADIAKYGLVDPIMETENGVDYNCAYSDAIDNQDISENDYNALTNDHGHYGKSFQFLNDNDTGIYSGGDLVDAILGDDGKSFDYIRDQIDHGNPVVIGVAVPDSLDESKAFLGGNGQHTIDATPSDTCSWQAVHAGDHVANARYPGHAIILVAYDDAQQMFTFKNSWGTSWGYEGYGHISYDYMKSYRWGPTTVVGNH